MNIAKLTTLAAAVAMLSVPAFAADGTKADSNKPAAKPTVHKHKSSKKACSAKSGKCDSKKDAKAK